MSVMSLTLTKTADPDPVQVGELLTYTLTYENLGDGVAHNVTIHDDLDPRVTLISADPAPSRNNTQSIPGPSPVLSRTARMPFALQVRVKEDSARRSPAAKSLHHQLRVSWSRNRAASTHRSRMEHVYPSTRRRYKRRCAGARR